MSIVYPDRIVLAREARGMTQKELSNRLEVTQGQLSKLENGRIDVAPELIDRLSRELSFRPTFFCTPSKMNSMPISFYRRRRSVAQKHLSRINALAKIMIERLEILSRSFENDHPEIPAVDLDEWKDSPESVAIELRRYWKLGESPIDDMARLLEHHGIMVIPFNFESPKIDAWSMGVSSAHPSVIFISNNTSGDRMRFTLAHELGHLMMHNTPVTPERDIEKEADLFAGEFLAPANAIRQQLFKLNLPKLAKLKLTWKISMAALIVRADQLECITKSQARYLWMLMSKHGYRTEEPVPLKREKPNWLSAMISSHLDELGYTVNELSEVLWMSADDFRDEYLPSPLGLRVLK